jgi:antitoxin CcdA
MVFFIDRPSWTVNVPASARIPFCLVNLPISSEKLSPDFLRDFSLRYTSSEMAMLLVSMAPKRAFLRREKSVSSGKIQQLLYTEMYYTKRMTELVSVRVDKETKELINKLGINVSETVRKALQEEIRRRREEELTEGLKKAKLILSKVSDQDIVRAVRETRDQR